MAESLTWETTEVYAEDEEATPQEQTLPESVTPVAITADGRPDPKWVRGKCPECGDDLVSNLYYVAGKGYLIVWECWATLSENPICDYRRVL